METVAIIIVIVVMVLLVWKCTVTPPGALPPKPDRDQDVWQRPTLPAMRIDARRIDTSTARLEWAK